MEDDECLDLERNVQFVGVWENSAGHSSGDSDAAALGGDAVGPPRACRTTKKQREQRKISNVYTVKYAATTLLIVYCALRMSISA